MFTVRSKSKSHYFDKLPVGIWLTPDQVRAFCTPPTPVKPAAAPHPLERLVQNR